MFLRKACSKCSLTPNPRAGNGWDVLSSETEANGLLVIVDAFLKRRRHRSLLAREFSLCLKDDARMKNFQPQFLKTGLHERTLVYQHGGICKVGIKLGKGRGGSAPNRAWQPEGQLPFRENPTVWAWKTSGPAPMSGVSASLRQANKSPDGK